MNEIFFKFEIDKDYWKETVKCFGKKISTFIIKIIFFALFILSIYYSILEKQILWYQIFVF